MEADGAPVQPSRPVPVTDGGLSPTLRDWGTGGGVGVGWVEPTSHGWRRGTVGFTHTTLASEYIYPSERNMLAIIKHP